ncbi:tetratricopeptide repeat protein [Dactylosporangium sp. McL0621]|uniref:tetratricopeptide repeat protein n=1 Tax=Dactylosporangium sp. McL0621 TaxID=3415678 RepID=UPI003CF1797F
MQRAAAEPEPLHEIVARCAGLPLALSIVAARAALQPHLPLSAFAGGLRGAAGGLTAFADDDPAVDVRAVFSWSFDLVPPAAARLFRLLGLHPGPDLTVPAAAGLAGVTPDAAGRMLATLARAHLVDEHRAGRYTLHDLLRAYAAEQIAARPAGERDGARRRIHDHHLHSACAAAARLGPQRDPIAAGAPAEGVTPERFAGLAAAMTWFDAEHEVLTAAIAQAYDLGLDVLCWQLAWAVDTFLERRGRWHQSLAVQTLALRAATRAADRAGQARAHGAVSRAHGRLGRVHGRRDHIDAAGVHLDHATALFTALGDDAGVAHMHRIRSGRAANEGDSAAAIAHAREALRLYRRVRDRGGEADALNLIGWYHAELGDQAAGLTHCEQALELYADGNDPWGRSATLDSIAYAKHRLGRHTEAIDVFGQALEIMHAIGDRRAEAAILGRLGDAHDAAGHPGDAADARRAARSLLAELTTG